MLGSFIPIQKPYLSTKTGSHPDNTSGLVRIIISLKDVVEAQLVVVLWSFPETNQYNVSFFSSETDPIV